MGLGLIATLTRICGLISRPVNHVLCLQLINRVVANVLADQIELDLVGFFSIFVA